jgi:hypothetical protein
MTAGIITSRLKEFLIESNRIEGISHVSEAEMAAGGAFLGLKSLKISDLAEYVQITQPDAVLRDKIGLNVRIGGYFPPEGGPGIPEKLNTLLKHANRAEISPFEAHIYYESLHPFTDGNGRSGRLLWLWMMCRGIGFPTLGFLHTFYYQTLAKIGRDTDEMPITPHHPEKWEVGMVVEYLKSSEWAWSKGTRGVVHRLYEPHIGKPGSADYQVFWVHPLDKTGEPDFSYSWWTTPKDVTWIEDT